ncbi:carbohydrate deacetylase [Enterococcus ureasiticus]|uniref:Carbohydrate deacetylase n=1 Tax=Enterococcus ureasiticus TaxID=903984 RepID=A0A1E5GHJ7_9ENTE|nr:carbohydrate deacetylase [Enterococcus ureasiticus]OEG12075.1 hypothetical protein BCR21_07515 [Enterococcus ureasiticus]
MKQVIINADDFGYSAGVNAGIIKSFKEGVLSSATLMANMPGREEAIQLAKEHPTLGVGGHLVLTCGESLKNRKTITDSTGNFLNLNQYKNYRSQMDSEEIFDEWSEQIDYLLGKGLVLTHLDSHHHVHTFKENLAITKRISEKYHLAFRNAFNLEKNLTLNYQKQITGFYDLMNYPNIRNIGIPYEQNKENCLNEIQTVLNQLENEEVTELMVHPAFVDETLYNNSSFNLARMKEVEVLCDAELKTLLEQNGVEIINYQDVVAPTLK